MGKEYDVVLRRCMAHSGQRAGGQNKFWETERNGKQLVTEDGIDYLLTTGLDVLTSWLVADRSLESLRGKRAIEQAKRIYESLRSYRRERL